MGGGASTRALTQYVKVEVLPATNTGGRSSGLWSSRENAGSSFRIDDAGIIVGCSAKVIESLTEASVDGAVVPSGEGAVVEVPDGTMARVDSSLGNEFEELCGFSQGSQVPRHVFADKSHSQLLVTKSGVEASGGGGGSSKDKDRGDGAAGSTQYYVVPRLEPFSRISGICKILGDRECPSKEKHVLRVGDFVRIGSVGLVVTEASNSLHAPPDAITAEQLWYLKPRAFAVVTPTDTTAQRLCGQAIISEPGSDKAPTAPPAPVATPSSSAASGDVRRARHRQLGEEGKRGEGKDSEEDEDEGGEMDRKNSGSTASSTGGGGGGGVAVTPVSVRRRGGASDSEEEDEGPMSPTASSAAAAAAAVSAVAGGGEGKEQAEEEIAMCYVCCDDDAVGADNPLVSACSCLGGTRWLHLKCLQRLLGSNGPQGPCVVFRNQNRNLICRVCRAEYLKQVELEIPATTDAGGGGKAQATRKVVIPIPQPSMRPPYICFKVVTHNAHNTFQDSIFNSFYHVSFASLVDSAANEPTSQPPPLPGFPPFPAATDEAAEAGGGDGGSAVSRSDGEPSSSRAATGAAASASAASAAAAVVPNARRPLVLGRSMDSDMQLNYQTVSGHHAALYYEGGEFSIQDLRSSNGTFVYLKEPLALQPSSSVRVRMGRKTLRISSVASTTTAAGAAAAAKPSSAAAASKSDKEQQQKETEETAAESAQDKATPAGADMVAGSGGGEGVERLPTVGGLKSLMVVARPSPRTTLPTASSGDPSEKQAHDSFMMLQAGQSAAQQQQQQQQQPPSDALTPDGGATNSAAGGGGGAEAAAATDNLAAPELHSQQQQQLNDGAGAVVSGGGELLLDDDGNEEDELEACTPRLGPGTDGPVLTIGGSGGDGDDSAASSTSSSSSSSTSSSNRNHTGGGGGAVSSSADVAAPVSSSSSGSVLQAVRGTFTRARPST